MIIVATRGSTGSTMLTAMRRLVAAPHEATTLRVLLQQGRESGEGAHG